MAGILKLAMSDLAALDWYIEDLRVILLVGEGDFGVNIMSLPDTQPGDATFLDVTEDLACLLGVFISVSAVLLKMSIC